MATFVSQGYGALLVAINIDFQKLLVITADGKFWRQIACSFQDNGRKKPP